MIAEFADVTLKFAEKYKVTRGHSILYPHPPMDELFCGVPLSRDFLRGPALFRDSEGSHSRDFLR